MARKSGSARRQQNAQAIGSARPRADLSTDIGDVALDRPHAEDELQDDLRVALARCQEARSASISQEVSLAAWGQRQSQ